jgi:hypothetical protein
MDEELSGGATPTGRPAMRNVTFSLDPFADDDQRLVCPPTDLAGELLMEIVLVAENGDRLEARSAEVSVVYQPRKPP